MKHSGETCILACALAAILIACACAQRESMEHVPHFTGDVHDAAEYCSLQGFGWFTLAKFDLICYRRKYPSAASVDQVLAEPHPENGEVRP